MRSPVRIHTRNLPASLVSGMKVFFPALMFFWLLIYTLAKTVPTHQLRGSQKFEIPQLGDKTQTIVGLATDVRRKIFAPTHAIIVAGHAVVRLNKVASAGMIYCAIRTYIHVYMSVFLAVIEGTHCLLNWTRLTNEGGSFLLTYLSNF